MIRLAIRLHRAQADVGLADLLTLVPTGVEETELADGSIEFAVYGVSGDLPAAPVLRALLGGAVLDISTSTVADDWADRWRGFHQPSEIAGRLRIRAPWEPALGDGGGEGDGEDEGDGEAEGGGDGEGDGEAEGGGDGSSCDGAGAVGIDGRRRGMIEIVIDPGLAFGTGAHPTTRLCVELLLSLEADGRAGGRLLDIGCGSGVLAIAATRLGWDPVVGVDHDPESVAATRANAAANDVLVEARLLDLRRDEIPDAPTMTANLLAPLLQDLAVKLSRPPTRLVASGLLHDQVDAVTTVFARRHGLLELDRRHDGEWAAVLLGVDP